MSRIVAIGVGCRAGVAGEAIAALARRALKEAGAPEGERQMFTLAAKAAEPGLIEAARIVGVTLTPLPTAALNAQAERINQEQAQAADDLEAARQRDDADATMYSATRILELDAQRLELAHRSNQFVASQQSQTQQSAYGLTKDEQEVARGIAGSDSRLTPEDRERIYAEQKYKYQRMVANGEYRSDQGTVRRP